MAESELSPPAAVGSSMHENGNYYAQKTARAKVMPAMPAIVRTRVFISYAHRGPAHQDVDPGLEPNEAAPQTDEIYFR
jgi:hypothetical protein